MSTEKSNAQGQTRLNKIYLCFNQTITQFWVNELCRYGGKTCYSKSLDMCDFHRDCIDGDDENNHICGEVYQINGQLNILLDCQMSWAVWAVSTCVTSLTTAATGPRAWVGWGGSRPRTSTTTCSSWDLTCPSTSAMTSSLLGSLGIIYLNVQFK